MIFGITHSSDGKLIQQLAVDVKLAIGLPPDPSKGRKAPTKLDQFVFLRKPPDATQGTDWKIDSELTKFYGPKCRAVEIVFLSDEIEEVFPTTLAWYKASHCVCRGNGLVAIRKTAEQPSGQEWTPCGPTCEDFIRGDCKPSGDLRFTLAAFPRMGSVARIHTSSYRSIKQISSALHQVRLITGGRLAGIRAHLVVSPEKTSFVDPKTNARRSTTIFALSIQVTAPEMKQLVTNMTEYAQVFESTRKMLGAGHIQVIEGEERAQEIAAEFYTRSDQGERLLPQPKLKDVATLDMSTMTPSDEPNRGHDDTGLEQSTSKKQPEKTMCGECRRTDGSHDEFCKYAKKPEEKPAEQQTEEKKADPEKTEQEKRTAQFTKAAYMLSEIEQKKTKEGQAYLVLSVTAAADNKSGKLYVWHEKIYKLFTGEKLDLSKPAMMMAEVSQKTKGDKPFVEVEHLLELAGKTYVSDAAAEKAEIGDSLFAETEKSDV